MRALTSSFALMVCAGFAAAQTQSTVAVVKVDSVIVRSGPSEKMAPCGKLDRDAEVIAHHSEGDWWAIQPPVGSISWISQLNVELKRKPGEATDTFPCNAVVNALDSGEVNIAAGMAGERKPLNVQRTKLPTGTLVQIIGAKAYLDGDDSKTGWYPILPPRDDFRYVPRAALELAGRVEKTGYVVKGESGVVPLTPEVAPVAAVPNPTPLRTAPESDGSGSQLWRDAESARANGDYAKAEELYMKLAGASNKAGDVKLANLCYERLHAVREQAQAGKSVSGGSPRPNEDPKLPPTVAVKPDSKTLLGEGILRTVKFEYVGKKVYALTDSKGNVRLYLIADGIELDRYVGKWVEIAGGVTYPRDFGDVGLLTGTRIEAVK